MAFLIGLVSWVTSAGYGALAWLHSSPVGLTLADEAARRRPRVGFGGAFGLVCCLVVVVIVAVAVLLIARNRRRPPQ